MVRLQPDREDWSPQERSEIDRLRDACKRHYGYELECNHTDEGDPWCIVYERERGTIVLHIARMDRRYIVVWPEHHCSDRTATLHAAIERALNSLDGPAARRARRASR